MRSFILFFFILSACLADSDDSLRIELATIRAQYDTLLVKK